MPAAKTMQESKVPDDDYVLHEPHNGPVGKLIDMSYEQYSGAKDMLAKNQVIGKRLTPFVDWTENTTKAILRKSPVAVDKVVSAVDTRAERVVNFTSDKVQTIRDTPKNTLGYVHGKLKSLRTEPQEAENEEPGVRTIIITGKSAAAERLNVLLDSSEGYLKQYLPISDDEKALMVNGSKSEIRTVATRTVNLSKVAISKAIERALNRAGEIKERTKETIHVDLIRYNEWLDMNVKQPVSRRLKIVDDKLAISEKVDKVDQKVVKPIKNSINRRVELIDAKVVTPVKEKFVLVVTRVSDTYQHKVVEPRDQIIQMFREELSLQQEIAKSKSGEEELTISAGLSAVIAAAKSRLEKEYEVRVSPALHRFMGREKEEEIEDQSFGDDVEEDEDVDETY
uniref:Thraustochytrid-specific lipid droplet protein 1 n=1 Tax=Aurantiochytrium limacinum TaxID=87102 RepID=A0A224ASZ0_9STRA|mmetsp:Transcript_10461/g.20616  ORF Transcript_10461/g.20616 Transcript_10461/m.20616 type:complete len:396 (-) Transcript_10461:437-1624(-)